MKTIHQRIKYFILLPIIFIHFSCENKTPTSSTVHNGDIIGSWKMTALTGTYTYTVSTPSSSSGVTWPASPDTSFGIRLKWEHEDNAAFQGGLAGLATFSLPDFNIKSILS